MSEIKKTLYFTKGMAIKHGGTLYPEGELIELSDEEAKPLKRWIEPSKAPSGGTEKAAAEKAAAEKADAEKADAEKAAAEKAAAEKAAAEKAAAEKASAQKSSSKGGKQ